MLFKLIALVLSLSLTGCGVEGKIKTSEYMDKEGYNEVMEWQTYRRKFYPVDTLCEESFLLDVDEHYDYIEGKITQLDLNVDKDNYISFVLDTEGIDIPCKVRKNEIGINIEDGTEIKAYGLALSYDGINFLAFWLEDMEGNAINDEVKQKYLGGEWSSFFL